MTTPEQFQPWNLPLEAFVPPLPPGAGPHYRFNFETLPLETLTNAGMLSIVAFIAGVNPVITEAAYNALSDWAKSYWERT